MQDVQALIKRETLISVILGGGLSAAFFAAVFGWSQPIPIWGVGAYVFDFLPQSFAIGLMASLVPGLLARKAQSAGRLPLSGPVWSAGAVLRTSFVHGVAALAIGTTLAAAVLWLSGLEQIAPWPGMLAKAAYGIVVAPIATRRLLRKMFAEA